MKILATFVLFALLTMNAFAAEGPDADAQAEQVAEPEPITVDVLSAKVTPHGAWIEDAQYGKVWRPNVVVTDVEWRPYVNNGHWVWTNRGWFWASDYEWGAYTFHYGRWVRHARHRWVWVPDCTWGPAWVSWRECDEAWGWAALPPAARFDVRVGFGAGVDFSFGLGVDDFIFVGCRDFLNINLHTHCWPRERCHKIYRHTTIVKNTYIVKNKTIINNGVSHKTVVKQAPHHAQPQKHQPAKPHVGQRQPAPQHRAAPAPRQHVPQAPQHRAAPAPQHHAPQKHHK